MIGWFTGKGRKMCGFVGYAGSVSRSKELTTALDSISHRGPDGRHVLVEERFGVGFARLAIRDLSENASQPVIHPESRFVLAFNGEIYNHKELRMRVERSKNRMLLETSEGDTVTLLALIDELGLLATLDIIRGMYALCIYFPKEDVLYLARDRFGQKQMYYKEEKGGVVFGSEIKAIQKMIGSSLYIDRKNLMLPFLQTHLPDKTKTIYKGVTQVGCGEVVRIEGGRVVGASNYFCVNELVCEDQYKFLTRLDTNEVAEICEIELKRSVNEHVDADTKVGTLYSGGLDSSLVALIADRLGHSYRVGFESKYSSDGKYFASFDKACGTITDIVNLREEEAIAELPILLYHYETINKPDGVILSQLTNRAQSIGAKVLLNGDGADEIFSGYSYFSDLYEAGLRGESSVTSLVRRILKRTMPEIGVGSEDDMVAQCFYSFVPTKKILLEPYLDLFLHEESRYGEWEKNIECFSFSGNRLEQVMMAFGIDEVKNRLPRYLHRSDRYGMASSVEMRAPFLDDNIVKLGINMPLRHKTRVSKVPFRGRKFAPKRVLKEAACVTGLPQEIIDRPKKGTSFFFYRSLMCIALETDLGRVSSLIGVKQRSLRESICRRYASSSYSREVLERYVYNVLCTEVLSRIFEDGLSPYEISDEFKWILDKCRADERMKHRAEDDSIRHIAR